MNIKTNKLFVKHVRNIITNYPAMRSKLFHLKEDLKTHGLSHKIFLKYDIKSLGNGFYRIKFIPIRVIIYVDDDTIYLDHIFKRKGVSDYKRYQ